MWCRVAPTPPTPVRSGGLPRRRTEGDVEGLIHSPPLYKWVEMVAVMKFLRLHAHIPPL